MAVREIRMVGDPVLRERTDRVEEVDDEVRELIDDMLETMGEAEGVGLAAPQIGVGRRVFVVDVHEPDVPPFALVNPEITVRSDECERGEEGCLSMPGLQEVVERPERVTIEGLDRNGERRRIEADGLLARVLQHEYDHLEGILFTDRISPLKRKMLLKKWKKTKKKEAAAA